MEIIIPAIEEMIEINKKLNGSIINRGSLEFLISKIKAKYKDREYKKQIAKVAAIIWMHITQEHPFLNGNKRTATETMLLFLNKNNFTLETSTAGKVYVSLKIANNEIKYNEIVSWIYERLKEKRK